MKKNILSIITIFLVTLTLTACNTKKETKKQEKNENKKEYAKRSDEAEIDFMGETFRDFLYKK